MALATAESHRCGSAASRAHGLSPAIRRHHDVSADQTVQDPLRSVLAIIAEPQYVCVKMGRHWVIVTRRRMDE